MIRVIYFGLETKKKSIFVKFWFFKMEIGIYPADYGAVSHGGNDEGNQILSGEGDER